MVLYLHKIKYVKEKSTAQDTNIGNGNITIEYINVAKHLYILCFVGFNFLHF